MQDKNTKYDSMAMTHFKLPIKKRLKKGENEIHPTNEQIFASSFSNTRFQYCCKVLVITPLNISYISFLSKKLTYFHIVR